MYAKVTTNLTKNNITPLKTKLCMDCGHLMVEVDSCIENDIHFIWYKCSKCNGQWLHKEMICYAEDSDFFSVPTRL